MTKHLIFLSVPGLRPRDIDRATTPMLYHWAAQGAIAELIPSFPCVTSTVQAGMITGTPPGDHGVIANGFFDRERRRVEFWVAHNDALHGEQIWDIIRAKRPDFRSAVWHAQNIKGAGADFIVTPSPIHEPDGTTKPWCYSKPDGLYQELLDAMGHFPLQHYWGPLANIESTRWILDAAAWLADRHAPNLHWIYIPHLDYAAQRFGPNSPAAKAALLELDRLLANFAGRVAVNPAMADAVFLVAGEYAMTDVTGAVYPNRILRAGGQLAVREEDGREQVDLVNSPAFAMVDHQIAHVYTRDAGANTVKRCRELFEAATGVAGVFTGETRASLGLDHPRSGEIILVSTEDQWFAYPWWLNDTAAPGYARTVDIHQKPGYDPVELFFDAATKTIPLETTLVKGSHGVPATGPKHRTALICSKVSDAVGVGRTYRDTDVKRISLMLLGL